MRLIDRLNNPTEDSAWLKKYMSNVGGWSIDLDGYVTISADNKETCGHVHQLKGAIKCLLSFDRLAKGYRLIYVLKKHSYTKDGCRQDSDTRVEMQYFSEQIKREARRLYKNFRRRYNPSLPEEFI